MTSHDVKVGLGLVDFLIFLSTTHILVAMFTLSDFFIVFKFSVISLTCSLKNLDSNDLMNL